MEIKQSNYGTQGGSDASIGMGKNSATTLQAFTAPESSAFASHDNISLPCHNNHNFSVKEKQNSVNSVHIKILYSKESTLP